MGAMYCGFPALSNVMEKGCIFIQNKIIYLKSSTRNNKYPCRTLPNYTRGYNQSYLSS